MSSDAPVRNPAQGAAAEAAAGERSARPLLGRHLHVVGRLVAIGREIAGAIWRELTARGARDAPASSLRRLKRLYDKVSRAARMALLLQERLVAERQRPEVEDAMALLRPWDALHSPFESPGRRVAVGEDRGQHGAWDEAGDCDQGGEPPERLERAARPPVDRLYRYVMSRPVPDLIEEICRAFGLEPAWLAEVEAEWDSGPKQGVAPAPVAYRARVERRPPLRFATARDAARAIMEALYGPGDPRAASP